MSFERGMRCKKPLQFHGFHVFSLGFGLRLSWTSQILWAAQDRISAWDLRDFLRPNWALFAGTSFRIRTSRRTEKKSQWWQCSWLYNVLCTCTDWMSYLKAQVYHCFSQIRRSMESLELGEVGFQRKTDIVLIVLYISHIAILVLYIVSVIIMPNAAVAENLYMDFTTGSGCVITRVCRQNLIFQQHCQTVTSKKMLCQNFCQRKRQKKCQWNS